MKFSHFIYRNYILLIVLIDIIIISASFLLFAWYKPSTIRIILPKYDNFYFGFVLIWISISYIVGKYNLLSFIKAVKLIKYMTITNLSIISTVAILLFALKVDEYSRVIVFGTITLSFILELLTFWLFYTQLKKNKLIIKPEKPSEPIVVERSLDIEDPVVELSTKDNTIKQELSKDQLLSREAGKEVLDYFSEHVNINESKLELISTTTAFNVENLASDIRTIINLRKVNDMRFINKFFEAVNHKLPDAGIFMGFLETSGQRYTRIRKKFPAVISQLVIVIDFFFNRILPRLSIFRSLYFNLTNGEKRTISKAEVLGRLVRCGFEIIEHKEIKNLSYFVVMKTGKPLYKLSPSSGPVYPMPKIGKDGNTIEVYKIRTMHPYSEFIREYVISLHGYSKIGKVDDDFRLTKWGKFLRKTQLDELPQFFINILYKRNMKLVGARPLSKEEFKRYPDDIKELRSKFKPGLFPPYAALKMQGKEKAIEAERLYFNAKLKNPRTTDIKFFFMAVYNKISGKIPSA